MAAQERGPTQEMSTRLCEIFIGFCTKNHLSVLEPPDSNYAIELTKRPAYAEQDGVVIHLLHSVVLQQHTRVRIHIGPRVLDLARLEQDRRHQVVELTDQLEEGIVG